MTAITTLEIYNMAYNSLLAKREREVTRNTIYKVDNKIDSKISIARIAKYDKQINELHDEIVRLESEIDYKLI